VGVQTTSKLPACFRRCFTFSYFNSIQSELLPVCFSDQNMLVSAPTGSGKTVGTPCRLAYLRHPHQNDGVQYSCSARVYLSRCSRPGGSYQS
jgi:hypothetical protein